MFCSPHPPLYNHHQEVTVVSVYTTIKQHTGSMRRLFQLSEKRRDIHVRIQILKNHKNIGFLSNSGSDSLNNYEATEPAFNIGPSSARQRTGRPMMARL